eukprot:3948627-Prymnesium_polylepis.1
MAQSTGKSEAGMGGRAPAEEGSTLAVEQADLAAKLHQRGAPDQVAHGFEARGSMQTQQKLRIRPFVP